MGVSGSWDGTTSSGPPDIRQLLLELWGAHTPDALIWVALFRLCKYIEGFHVSSDGLSPLPPDPCGSMFPKKSEGLRIGKRCLQRKPGTLHFNFPEHVIELRL